jgi:hypothetical protein
MTQQKMNDMLTITQSWLDAYPNWVGAGWQVGDTCDLVYILNLAPQGVNDFIDAHPPHKPA